ncbi:Aste57867_3668 [Aphanomyces stellatus]|uniref:Aste57867_3668 protein n=1 Tax=Aphanomyces stellatus TaxID=120398 RepID=A0A485KB05_9STRA|nr:hypothetical protein As57867_003657 [Aphanomyces stellatus]VFT80823.1 Aste57867_3668 [Aphanomyces stellatus]
MTWSETFGPELQTKGGLKSTDDLLAGKKYVGLYFSAHWCPPCRAFTPMLSETYETFIGDGHKDFALIFVSSDRDEAAFDEYYGEMPFYALPYAKRDEKDALAKKFEIRGIPTLVFVNAAGELLTKDGRQVVSNARGDPDRVLAALAEAK